MRQFVSFVQELNMKLLHSLDSYSKHLCVKCHGYFYVIERKFIQENKWIKITSCVTDRPEFEP
jgi:hypothetical protein